VTTIDLGRPTQGDVAVRGAFSALHVAHAEADERYVCPARDEVGPQVRADLGEQFVTERNRELDEDCGTITNVRKIVAAARRKGLLDD
jgi:2C-methyl-D-erythritol 2,4-cyclodiphosphate synthase